MSLTHRSAVWGVLSLMVFLWSLNALAFLPDEPTPQASKPRPASKPKQRPKPKPASPKVQVSRSKSKPQPVTKTDGCFTDANEETWCKDASGTQLNSDEANQRVSEEKVAAPKMVRLPSGISMGKYEVTQGEWLRVMGSNPSRFSSCGDDCPVENVSWNEVQDYIERLNRATGGRYRLPTEGEWEAACQAGGYREYCGSDNIDAVAWYDENSGSRTHVVGQKAENAWGLYDMSGNVCEWTNSCWEGDCSRRVYRGGSWYYRPDYVRSATRLIVDPTVRDLNLGFRLAQD